MTSLDRERTLALLGDRSRPLAEVAEAMGYANYSAFAAACRRMFGAGPRELREGRAYRGSEPTPRVTASALYQVRCTPSEHAVIAEGVGALAQREGATHGAVLAKVVREAVRRRPKK